MATDLENIDAAIIQAAQGRSVVHVQHGDTAVTYKAQTVEDMLAARNAVAASQGKTTRRILFRVHTDKGTG